MLKLTGKEKRFLVFIALTILLFSSLEWLTTTYRLGLAKGLEKEFTDLAIKEEEAKDQKSHHQKELEQVKLENSSITDEEKELITEDKKEDLEEKISKVNINTASYNELLTIKGIGPVLAERIISYRIQKGRFLALDELREVKGIGAKTFEKIKPYLTI